MILSFILATSFLLFLKALIRSLWLRRRISRPSIQDPWDHHRAAVRQLVQEDTYYLGWDVQAEKAVVQAQPTPDPAPVEPPKTIWERLDS